MGWNVKFSNHAVFFLLLISSDFSVPFSCCEFQRRIEQMEVETFKFNRCSSI